MFLHILVVQPDSMGGGLTAFLLSGSMGGGVAFWSIISLKLIIYPFILIKVLFLVLNETLIITNWLPATLHKKQFHLNGFRLERGNVIVNTN